MKFHIYLLSLVLLFGSANGMDFLFKKQKDKNELQEETASKALLQISEEGEQSHSTPEAASTKTPTTIATKEFKQMDLGKIEVEQEPGTFSRVIGSFYDKTNVALDLIKQLDKDKQKTEKQGKLKITRDIEKGILDTMKKGLCTEDNNPEVKKDSFKDPKKYRWERIKRLLSISCENDPHMENIKTMIGSTQSHKYQLNEENTLNKVFDYGTRNNLLYVELLKLIAEDVQEALARNKKTQESINEQKHKKDKPIDSDFYSFYEEINKLIQKTSFNN